MTLTPLRLVLVLFAVADWLVACHHFDGWLAKRHAHAARVDAWYDYWMAEAATWDWSQGPWLEDGEFATDLFAPVAFDTAAFTASVEGYPLGTPPRLYPPDPAHGGARGASGAA